MKGWGLRGPHGSNPLAREIDALLKWDSLIDTGELRQVDGDGVVGGQQAGRECASLGGLASRVLSRFPSTVSISVRRRSHHLNDRREPLGGGHDDLGS